MKKLQYSHTDQTMTKDFYEYFLKRGDDDAWGEPDKFGNFQLLCKIADYTNRPLEGASVLDVGCGTGDFAGFLLQKGIKQYVGIDIVEETIYKARMKYPQQDFIVGDFLEYYFEPIFDFVFASGAFALKLKSDNYVIMEGALAKMWQLARVGVAFNFLTTGPEEQDELFIYDLNRVMEICQKVAPEATLSSSLNRAGGKHEFLQTHIYLKK